MKTVFILLIVYQLKHWIADYPLQGKYMLGKFLPGKTFFLPLLAHVSVHGVMTFGIAYCYVDSFMALLLALLDMSIHFIMDRIKASPNLMGRWKPLTKNEYITSLNMTKGLNMIDGKPMPNHIPEDSLVIYKAQGHKDLRGNTLFWWCLGIDQMVHHLTHYLIIYLIVS